MERVLKQNGESADSQRTAQAKFTSKSREGELANGIDDSPAMVAQRKKLQSLFGGAIQRQGAEEEMLQGKFDGVQRVEEEEPLQGKFEAVQRVEEEEPLQGKFEAVQRVEEEEPLQGKFASESSVQLKEESAAKPNNTGLPDNLKSGIESLSGMSMDNVKVHYNSSQPAQLNALAYAQGTDIHVAPGQEQHLPHEAWHVVQQAQGRVRPTMQMKEGVPVNDDKGLEHEADVMGAKAIAIETRAPSQLKAGGMRGSEGGRQQFPGGVQGLIVQRKSGWERKEKDGKYYRVANKDVVRAVPSKDLGLPKNSIPVAGGAESQGKCWCPDVDDSTSDTAAINVMLEHDSDPGAKITPYKEGGYTAAPLKSEFQQESHYHKGTIPAKRAKSMLKAGTDNFGDKPVSYTDSNHDYVDENAAGPTLFNRGL